MTPAFGFSVGDFIQIIELCAKISQALKNTAYGASSEYQHLTIELSALQKVLSHLAALHPNEQNINHVNAIRGMALACQFPLQEFLNKLQYYEKNLGPWARNSLTGAAKKAKWAVFVSEKVAKFRALVSAKTITINLLLSLQISETVSTHESRAGTRHNVLMMNIQMQRSKLDSLWKEARQVKEELVNAQRDTHKRIRDLEHNLESKLGRISENTTRLARSYNALKTRLDSSRASLMNLRSLPAQIVTFLGTFPAEIRALLQKLLQTNMQIYITLLRVQDRLASSPSLAGSSYIYFEDGMGIVRELPYEWFKYWETFSGLLQAEFKSTPARAKITNGEFHLTNSRYPGTIMRRDEWEQRVFPGARITMHMITNISIIRRMCPRPSCVGIWQFQYDGSPKTTCRLCGLSCTVFTPMDNHPQERLIENTLRDAQNLHTQVEEDLELLGSWNSTSYLPAELELMQSYFIRRISVQAKVQYFKRFITHFSTYFWPRPGSSCPQCGDLSLTKQLSRLQPDQIPGIVAILRVMDKLSELIELRTTQMEEMEIYRNMCVISREHILTHLFPAHSDGFSRTIFQFGFAAFREKSLSEVQTLQTISFNDWLHQILRGKSEQEQDSTR